MSRDDDVLNFMQGRLSDADKARFERDLEGDADLRAEIAVLKAARAVLSEEPATGNQDGWKRLSTTLDAEHEQTRPSRPANTNRPIWVSFAQVAGIAAAAIALWQFVAVPNLGFGPQDRFTPASELASGPVLQVMFADAATMGEVSQILAELDGTLVSGPGAMGIYRIAFTDQDARAAAQASLSERGDLVDEIFVE